MNLYVYIYILLLIFSCIYRSWNVLCRHLFLLIKKNPTQSVFGGANRICSNKSTRPSYVQRRKTCEKPRFCCPLWEMPPNISPPFGEPRDLMRVAKIYAAKKNGEMYVYHGGWKTFLEILNVWSICIHLDSLGGKYREITPDIECLELSCFPSKIELTSNHTPFKTHSGGRGFFVATLIFRWAGITLFTNKNDIYTGWPFHWLPVWVPSRGF